MIYGIMKHLLLTLLIVLSSTYGFAKDAEVILTRFYTQEEHSIIPDKTDQFQVQISHSPPMVMQKPLPMPSAKWFRR